MKTLITLLVTMSLMPVSAFAAKQPMSPQEDPKYYTLDLKTAQVETIPMDQVPTKSIQSSAIMDMTRGGGTTGLDQASQVLMVADQVVNLTAKIWSLIEKNQPVVTIPGKSPYATAVPKGIKTWTYLTGWKGPKTVVKRFTCKNLYGMKVIDIRYAVSYAYAGSYRGKGRYLTAVSAEPVSVNVLWGYKLSMSAEVPDPTVINKGTVANPMAALELVVKYSVHTAIQHSELRDIYYIRGDGLIREMISNSSLESFQEIKDGEVVKYY